MFNRLNPRDSVTQTSTICHLFGTALKKSALRRDNLYDAAYQGKFIDQFVNIILT